MFSNQALRRLIFPLVIEQILAMLVGMADTMMVSYAGEAAISGVALVDMLTYMIITILTSLATGGAVIVSQYLGNRDAQNAERSAGQLMMTSFVLSAAITLVCAVFYKGLIRLFFGSIAPDVMQAAETYLLITVFSFPFLGIYNAGAALFRSMKRTNTTMYVSLIMNIINVAGNAIGIFVMRAGIVGVAVPTLISRAVAGILMTALAFDRKNELVVRMKNIFCRDADMVRRILKIAIPNSIENGLFAFGRVLVTSIVALFGTVHIAANGVANTVDLIAILVVQAMNLAMVTVVGQCVGACKYDEAEYYTKKLIKISYVATALLSALVWLALPYILRLFELSPETARYTTTLVLIHNGLATLMHPTSFNLSNSLRAAGDVKFTMYVGIISILVFRLGAAILLGIVMNLGVIGVWIAMGFDWLSRSIFFVLRFRSGKWRNFRAI